MNTICVYYESKTQNILEIIPHNIEEELKAHINKSWQQPVCQKILKTLSSKGQMTISTLAKELNHSVSTIHENVKKLEQQQLIKTKISYTKKKQRVITTNILFATKSPKYKESISKFFQGLWVNSQDNTKIIEYLQKNKTKKFSIAEISAGTNLPVHRIEIALSNWDNIITRGISQAKKEQPFIKEVTYQGK